MPTHGSPRAGDPWSRPVDRLLWALRAVGLDYRCSPSGAWSWRATCPACGTAEALAVSEAGPGGAVSISCRCARATGCSRRSPRPGSEWRDEPD